ncbi:phytanoyl-CoA dioxygenase family protein [Paenibacillus eucommiae]|uniref:Ectoine hydroxylase-related dioxygenase (Phytanoyl-CoA dioxygenase family) n=1 Tax=Paenibacillus eucommiae TaxID=1355755 RepID=A0ABS4ISK7_9BACL|nr:phytanoyl-CoA dioxygenase family protein [Paenibacillus eucommiae]MBP1990548.1 ectoine hydroxylase-related dioxygenase (phytanoyl-CoA dioxygenase family) [Paenibacillus eucommiae]
MNGQSYQIGERTLEMGSKYLTELRSSNDIMDNVEALRARLKKDGYLLIRDFHNREQVLAARNEFLRKLQSMGRLEEGSPLELGRIHADNKSAIWGKGVDELKEDFPQFLEVVNGPRVMSFFEKLLGGPCLTYDYKWPRAIARGGNTGAHYDVVYMGRGTKNVYTLWTPFDDISLEKGTLAMCLGSQDFDKVRQTYGELDVDRDNVAKGWFSEDPVEIVDKFHGQWATTPFRAGDAILFGMYMMHSSLNNTTDFYRISSDTRYQLASEPVDERWIGAKPKGHYAWGKTPEKSMEEARKEWGV